VVWQIKVCTISRIGEKIEKDGVTFDGWNIIYSDDWWTRYTKELPKSPKRYDKRRDVEDNGPFTLEIITIHYYKFRILCKTYSSWDHSIIINFTYSFSHYYQKQDLNLKK